MKPNILVLGMAAVLLLLPAANAAMVTVSVENNQPDGGFTFSPLWHAFHDGTFDAFDEGMAASPGIEMLAELANPTQLNMEFDNSGASGVTGVLASVDPPPPFIPGESNMLMVDVGDATVNRYFSFGAMVVPSNDLFIGNDDPMAWEVFDNSGNFLGPITIQLFGMDVWDAGTEVNDATNGIAFIMGQDATEGADEDGVVTSFFDLPGAQDYLDSLNGLETPVYTLTDLLTSSELLATITITPEPTSLALFGLVGGALALRRRR